MGKGMPFRLGSHAVSPGGAYPGSLRFWAWPGLLTATASGWDLHSSVLSNPCVYAPVIKGERHLGEKSAKVDSFSHMASGKGKKDTVLRTVNPLKSVI